METNKFIRLGDDFHIFSEKVFHLTYALDNGFWNDIESSKNTDPESVDAGKIAQHKERTIFFETSSSLDLPLDTDARIKTVEIWHEQHPKDHIIGKFSLRTLSEIRPTE